MMLKPFLCLSPISCQERGFVPWRMPGRAGRQMLMVWAGGCLDLVAGATGWTLQGGQGGCRQWLKALGWLCSAQNPFPNPIQSSALGLIPVRASPHPGFCHLLVSVAEGGDGKHSSPFSSGDHDRCIEGSVFSGKISLSPGHIIPLWSPCWMQPGGRRNITTVSTVPLNLSITSGRRNQAWLLLCSFSPEPPSHPPVS